MGAYWLPTLLLVLVFSATAQHFAISEKVLAKIRLKYGETAERRLQHWQEMIYEHRDSDDMERLR
ncbi:MAG: hypothetical protein EP334_00865, partial [Gammaproteobacteria bacterium]